MGSTLPMLSRRCSRASNLFIDRLSCIVFDDLWYSSQAMIIHMPRASLNAPKCGRRRHGSLSNPSRLAAQIIKFCIMN
jgi:hypothetical protein